MSSSSTQVVAERIYVKAKTPLDEYADVKLPRRVTLPTEKRVDARSGVTYEVPKRFYFVGYDTDGNEFSIRAYPQTEKVTLPDGSKQDIPAKWAIEVKDLDPEKHRTPGILHALKTGFLIPAD